MSTKVTLSGGAFQDPSGTVIANGSLVLTLSQDGVANTSQIAPRTVSFALDGSGNLVAGALIWGNDNITPAGTTYRAEALNSGGSKVWGPETWSLTGAGPINVGTIVPTSIGVSFSNPVVTNPTALQTIATFPLQVPLLQIGTVSDTGLSRDSAGVIDVGNGNQGDKSGSVNLTNLTATGTATLSTATIATATVTTENVKTLNNIVKADQFPGATADVQITNAIAALPSTGGTVDARGYGATTQVIASQLVIGSATKPITLLLDRNTLFQVTVTGGVDAIQLWTKCAMIACGSNAGTATFQLQSTANVSSLIASKPATSAQSIIVIEGITLQGNTSATVTGAMLELVALTDASSFRNMIIYGFGNCYGMRLSNVSGGAIGPCNFYNCSVNGNANAGAKPVLIRGVSGGASIVGVNFHGCSFTHPGTGGLVICDLQGSSNNAIQNVNFYGCQMESSNTGDIGLQIVDSTGVYVSGLTFSANVNNGTSCVRIAQSAGVTYDIVLDQVIQANAWTNTIADAINSVNITDARVSRYTFLPASSALPGCSFYGSSGQVFALNNTGVASVQPLTLGSGGTPLTLAKVYTPSLTPGSVNAATVAEQTFTVTGLTTADKIVVDPPSIANATGIAGARVSAADTLAIRFVNPTAGALTPTSGTYTVLAFRS